MIFEDFDHKQDATVLHDFYEEDILKAVRVLPPTSQEVFRLYAIEGYSHAEIGKTLNISEGTSKWHLSTAREKLRKLIQPNGEFRVIQTGTS